MKKTFSKFLATAAAVSMLASVATVVNADEIAFKTRAVEGGVVITGVAGADAATEITIPETIGDAAVIGVDDCAFLGIEDLAVINAPKSLKSDFIGNVAFLTNRSVKAFMISEVGAKATEDDVVLYVATKLSYNGKTADFTKEELAEVKTKIDAKAKLAGVPDGASYEEAAVIMLQNKEAMNLTAATSDKLAIWEAAVPSRDLTVNAPDGSDAAKYWAPKAEAATVTGDANNDKVVNVRDAAAIAAALAKGDAEVAKLPAQADYNMDGVINVRDAAAIANMLAKA